MTPAQINRAGGHLIPGSPKQGLDLPEAVAVCYQPPDLGEEVFGLLG